jgi:hypothetical protein
VGSTPLLFANSICTSAIELFDLIPIRCLERPKDANIKRLKLVRAIGRQTAVDDVLKVIRHQLQRLMRREAVIDQYSWLTFCFGSGQRIEHVLDPVQTDFRIRVACFGHGEVPAGRWISGPGAPMGRSRPNDEWW